MNKILNLVILKQLYIWIFSNEDSFASSLENIVCLSSNVQVFIDLINQ